MEEIRGELVRIARESGIPVPHDASVTDVVTLLGSDASLSPELSEALDAILGGLHQ